MPLIRGHHSFDSHFTQVPNDWVRDSRLSFKARGLLVLLMSHTPGWNMSIRSIARHNGTGVDTIKTAVLELEQNGYLVRSEAQSKNEDGTFADYVWTTCDPFQNPVTDKPVHGKQDTKNTNTKEEQVTKNKNRTIVQGELEPAFLEFWQIYPRRSGKEAAKKAFAKAAKAVGVDVVLEGARRFASDPYLPTKQFVAHPATWLNQGRWDDDPLPPRELTQEEKMLKAKERADRDRALAAEENARQRAEAERVRQEVEANPPQHCEHDRIVWACRVCAPLALAAKLN